MGENEHSWSKTVHAQMARQAPYQHACQPKPQQWTHECGHMRPHSSACNKCMNHYLATQWYNTKSHSKGWLLWPRQQRYEDTCLPQSHHFSRNLHVEPYSSTLWGKGCNTTSKLTIPFELGLTKLPNNMHWPTILLLCNVQWCSATNTPACAKARHVQKLPNNQWSNTV